MQRVFFEDGILRFDGEIVELFPERGPNVRFHMHYIKKIELVEGRRGVLLMNLDYGKGGGFSGYIVLPESVDHARQMIAVIEAAKQNY
ncbi:MAG TPA: hypothetical protein VJ965_08170 [Anaerolineales bacterium]|nr:hypothetical protein [Anaerolineales bacterium]